MATGKHGSYCGDSTKATSIDAHNNRLKMKERHNVRHVSNGSDLARVISGMTIIVKLSRTDV